MATAVRSSSARRPARARPGTEAGLALAVLAFLAVSAVWFALDARVPDFDSGRHLGFALSFRDALAAGDLLAPLEDFTRYPPLAHLVGAAGMLVGGAGTDAAALAQNLVFVPLLALGCYGAGRVAYGPRAGLLAAIFALGTPMVVSLFHAHMLDAPQAALVAVTVWLVLASRRFARPGVAAAAGAAFGLAMLTKQTSVLFVAGLLLVVLARGGWRHLPGLLAFGLAAAVLAGPWYLLHLDELRGLTAGAAAGTPPVTPAGDPAGNVYPPRWSAKNAGWYVWNLVNLQLLLPLALLFVGGTVAAVLRFARSRDRGDLTPELVVGGLVSYLAVTWISLKDPRYTLPALVYMAVLGTGWTAWARPRLRAAGTVAVVALAVLNVGLISSGTGGTTRIELPGAPESGLGERAFTLHSDTGYLIGRPYADGEVLELLRAMPADGFERVEFDPGGSVAFNVEGLEFLRRIAGGIGRPPAYDPVNLGPRDGFLMRRFPAPGDPPPCVRMTDGSTLYVVLGDPTRPWEELDRFYCPFRSPDRYRADRR